jgi:uncharacterized coiled-coil DUF342 family protein
MSELKDMGKALNAALRAGQTAMEDIVDTGANRSSAIFDKEIADQEEQKEDFKTSKDTLSDAISEQISEAEAKKTQQLAAFRADGGDENFDGLLEAYDAVKNAEEALDASALGLYNELNEKYNKMYEEFGTDASVVVGAFNDAYTGSTI